MADILKVLMMGGQRAGKTSMLAGLIETMTHGKVKDIIDVKDITESKPASLKLIKSIECLKWNLLSSYGKTYLIDEEKSGEFEVFMLEISIPNTDNKMSIQFSDVSGEYYDMGRTHDEEVRKRVKEYDVFLIAIDTPNLMEAINPDNRLCNEAINNSYNHVNDIYTFLSELDDKDGADAKLVIFVPLKCEKWAKEGKINQVVERVKTVYAPSLHALSQYTNVEVDIMPIQTVGNIVFQEQAKAMSCIINGITQRKCAIINKKTQVRFEDGTIENIDFAKHRFQEDSNSVIREHSSLVVPNSWFTTIGKEYEPRNCDQLAFYILQFYLAKVLFAKEVENLKEKKRNWKWGKRIAIGAFWLAFGIPGAIAAYFTSKYLAKKFGTITLEQMLTTVKKLQDGGFIKKNSDGIETIKESKLHAINEIQV